MKFDLRKTISRYRKSIEKLGRQVEGVSVNIPGGIGSITLKPDRTERDISKETVIFLSDRRVLDSAQCCDDCVESAMVSLQEIRTFLVQQQMKLKGHTDSIVFLLLDLMLEEIRQFQTYIESRGYRKRLGNPADLQVRKALSASHDYIDELSKLRGELLALLSQLSNIAGIPVKNRMMSTYDHILAQKDGSYTINWNQDCYLLNDSGESQQ